ncbi:hypothetical protein ACH5RR_041116 [Cinchona calisaya]
MSSDFKGVQVVLVNDEYHRLPELSNSGFSSFGYGDVVANLAMTLCKLEFKTKMSSSAVGLHGKEIATIPSPSQVILSIPTTACKKKKITL